MNAFATGQRDDALMAVSDGLLRWLELREQAGVFAHDVSHMANGDVAVKAFAELLSRITAGSLHRRHEALRLQREDGGPRALQQVLGGGADEEPRLAGPAQGG